MSAEKLRLEAEMRDNASPVVRKLRGELDKIRATPGMQAATGWLNSLNKEAEGFMTKGGGAAGVINAMGVGGLTSAASLAGLVAIMKDLGTRTLAMKELGREVGLTTDQINAFGHAGMHFGVGADAMHGALNHFSSQMPEFRRNMGSLYHELSRFPDLIKKLQGEGTEEQLEDIFKFLGQKKLQNEPQLQKQLLGAFFGSGDELEKLFAQGGKGFLDELAKQRQQLGTISPEMLKQAQDFRDAQIKFNDSLERFENSVGPKFLSMMTAIVDKAAMFFNPPAKTKEFDDDPAVKAQKEKLKAAGRAVGDFLTGKPMGGPAPAPAAPQQDLKPLAPRARLREMQQEGLLHKSAYDGENRGLFQRASFVQGGLQGSGSVAGFGAEGVIASGTRLGVLAALRELMATDEVGKGGGGGLLNASYGNGSLGGGGGGGSRGRGGGGGGGGSDESFPAGSSLEEVRSYIRAKAQSLGIDPNIAERVARSEGLNRSLGAGGDGGTSDGPYQLHVGGGLGDEYQRKFGRSIHDKRYWRDQVDFALGKAREGGWGPWHGWHGPAFAGIGGKPDSTALDALRKAGVGDPDKAGAGGMPNVAGGYSYPGHIMGQLKLGDESYRFGSGGVRGASSIPFGDYPITPNGIGPWGRAHGALGINNDHIYDKALGRMREGIEMHIGHSMNLITEGCLAFDKEQFPKLKARIAEMIKRNGAAYLHVGKNGASITPRRAEGLNPDPGSGSGKQEQPRLDAHIHVHHGAPPKATVKSNGMVEASLHLHRWQTMTEPSSVG